MNGTIDTVSKYFSWNTPNTKKKMWKKKEFGKFQNKLKMTKKKKNDKKGSLVKKNPGISVY